MSVKLVSDEKIAETSSKGNQEKCRFVNDFGHDKKKEIQREKANQEDASDDY